MDEQQQFDLAEQISLVLDKLMGIQSTVYGMDANIQADLQSGGLVSFHGQFSLSDLVALRFKLEQAIEDVILSQEQALNFLNTAREAQSKALEEFPDIDFKEVLSQEIAEAKFS